MSGADPCTGSNIDGKATVWVDVAACGEPDSASHCRSKISQDVAEEVVGHDDVKACRVGDQEDRRGVNMQIVGGDSGISAATR